MSDVPDYFFRVRENGAVVFRLDGENRNRRLEMEQIAVVNMRSGEVRPHGDRTLGPADLSAIRDWMAGRTETLARRETDEVERTIEQLNLVAHWAQSKASDTELERLTDALLMAMHDLRTVLVRRTADRLGKAPSGRD
jgi:hypothetical protein